jgi:hypothetical protein
MEGSDFLCPLVLGYFSIELIHISGGGRFGIKLAIWG